MRVGTNTIGNYFPQRTRNISNIAQKANIQKTTKTLSVEETITSKEKALFAKLYPEQREEIMEYHYYQKNGAMAGVTLGSLFDRRG